MNNERIEQMETDPLTLRMIKARTLNSCISCDLYIDNRHAHPSRRSFCVKYPAMIDMIACYKHRETFGEDTEDDVAN